MAEEESVRLFRDENGDRLSEPDEVVLPSALTKPIIATAPADRVPLPNRSMLENVQSQATIQRDIIRRAFGQAVGADQEDQSCSHRTTLGFPAIIEAYITPDGTPVRRICTLCNRQWSGQESYQQQASNAQQIYQNSQTYQQQANAMGLGGSAGAAGLQAQQSVQYTNGIVESVAQEMNYRLSESLRSLSEATTPTDQETLNDTAETYSRAGVLTVTGIRNVIRSIHERNDLPVRAGNPVQFFQQDLLNDPTPNVPDTYTPEPDRWEGTYGWNTTLGVGYRPGDDPAQKIVDNPYPDPKPYPERTFFGKILYWFWDLIPPHGERLPGEDIPEPYKYVSPRKRSFLSKIADKVRGIKPWTRDLADIAKEVEASAPEDTWCPAHPLDDCYCEGCMPPHKSDCYCEACSSPSAWTK